MLQLTQPNWDYSANTRMHQVNSLDPISTSAVFYQADSFCLNLMLLEDTKTL